MSGPAASEVSERPAPRTGTHLHDLLGPWVPHQRWYPAKGREARLEVVGTLELPLVRVEAVTDGASGDAPAGDDEVRVLIHMARVVAVRRAGDETGGEGGDESAGEVVQIPLVHRRVALTGDRAAASLLGTLTEMPAPGSPEAPLTWYVYDGPHDPAFTDALLAMLAGSIRALGLGPDGTREEAAGAAAGRRPPGAVAPPPGSPARVLRGEQSNTSIIVEPAAGPPIIVKVFRTLHAGRNPDVEVQAALSAAGVSAVPALAGWIEGSWPTGSTNGTSGAGGVVSGDLAVASEFLAGAQDAWREAVAALAGGVDFSSRAHDLGATTAAVHRAMGEHLPSRAAAPDDATALLDGMRQRAAWAVASAPSLAPHAQALSSALDTFEVGELPTLQRVHGDYHLGQVLHVPDRGWVLLDFEGEPLRPLSERTLPDLALRDVAGMLRSFDYAAAQARATGISDEAATSWANAAREGFLDGYTAGGGGDPRARQRLLDALELDKALYEVVYETRNRPEWIGVPLGSIGRLLGRLSG